MKAFDISEKDELALNIQVSGALAEQMPIERRQFVTRVLWKAGLLGFRGGMFINCSTHDEDKKWKDISDKIAAQQS